MQLWQSVILGAVQGVTEWLPISSSGHLVIFQKLFNINVPIAFDVLLHFSTLLVLFVFYHKDIKKIVTAWITLNTKSKEFTLGLFLIIGTIPIAIFGLLFNDFIKQTFESFQVVGFALIFTGIILQFTKKRNKQKNKETKVSDTHKVESKNLNFARASLIGLSQMFAIFPGVSRSGITISSSLILNISKQEATRFSFMLAIPAILGATILEAPSIIHSNLAISTIIGGMLSSFIVGYISLKWLLKVIQKENFYKFSYYTIPLGTIIILTTLF